MFATLYRVLLAAFASLLIGCGSAKDTTAPVGESKEANTARSLPTADSPVARNEAREPNSPATPPPNPLALAAPAPAAKEFGDNDLSTISSHTLSAAARKCSADGEYADAVQLQHWCVANGEGDSGLYNLACYYSLAGDVDASLYWLQVAAAKEGVDAGWAERDSDLRNVRRDPRWGGMRRFFEQYNRYWQLSGQGESTLVLPAGYDAQQPLPVMVGLHGMSSRAKNFVDDSWQDTADELQVALVGVDGTVRRGPAKYVWSEDPIQDAARIEQALQQVSDRVKIAPDKIILFGFSQGAMVAAEVAARNPDRFAGALVMSPGGTGDPTTGSLTETPAHARQGYVLVCGAEEHPGNVQMTADYAAHMRRLKARVEHAPYPDISEHAFPPDFIERLPAWIAFITDPGATEVAAAESKPEPETEQGDGDGKGSMFAFVCLSEEQVPDEATLRKAFDNWFDDFELEVDAEKGSVTITVGETYAIAQLIAKPVPADDIKYACGNAFLWPEAWQELENHKAQLLVVAQGDFENRYDRPVFLSRVIAAMTEAFPASGIYWGDARVVHSPQAFRSLTVKQVTEIEDVPAVLWVGFLRDKHDDGSVSFYTQGLSEFGCMEFEVVQSRQKPSDLFGFLLGLAQYSIFSGSIIDDGDTVGGSGGEKIKTRYAESEIGRDGKVIRVEY